MEVCDDPNAKCVTDWFQGIYGTFPMRRYCAILNDSVSAGVKKLVHHSAVQMITYVFTNRVRFLEVLS
uniref:Uncharacterized protein n=1 Tax=Acrobeloides nanus TaxID=290746 RepID=A0A914DMD9_9BILA